MAPKGKGSKYRGTVVEFPDFNPSSDAEVLYNAMKGLAYGRDLEADIVSDTSGHFKKMLVVLLQGTREEDDVVSEDLVEQDAQDLFDAGEVQWGTDEAKFITILGNRSVTHLQMVFDKYEKIANKEIEDSIRGELSGDFEKLMLAVVQCIRSVPMYFAKRLFKAMKGLGTADNTLIRIMVSRAEIDMLDIREFFRLSYEKSLYNMIKDDTSGEYKRSLLKLCGGDDDLAGEFFPEAAQLAYKMWEVSSMTRVELKGTVQPAANFNPDSDAQALRKAMKGFGTDEDTIIDIVTHRSNAQRQEILQKYKSLLGRDLMADLKNELSGSLCRLILGLMMTPAQFDAKMMRKAMEVQIKKQCQPETRSQSSDHSIALAALSNSQRLTLGETGAENTSSGFLSHSTIFHVKWNQISYCTCDGISPLCCGFPHTSIPPGSPWSRLFQEFVTCTNKDVEQVIRKEISGDLKTALIAIVRSIKNKPSYFADRLYKSMKGLGTDDRTLIRVLISRSEIDLFNIRREYKELHDVSLHESIKVEALCVSYIFIHYSEREMVTNHIGLIHIET
ncbi:UNVERIFIED_CONTAM: hypothetical protein FKN15_055754 [Acipenser sinensis]